MCIDIEFPIIMTRYVTSYYELNFVNSKVKKLQEGMFNKTAFIWQGLPNLDDIVDALSLSL